MYFYKNHATHRFDPENSDSCNIGIHACQNDCHFGILHSIFCHMKFKCTFIQAYLFRHSRDGDIEYLLLRRAKDEILYPGMWQMITGRIEGEETAVDCARREILEETGIECPSLVVVPYVASFYFAPDDSIHHVPVFAAEVTGEAAIRLSDEHDDHAWLPFDEAWKQLVFPGHREGLRILRDYLIEDARAREMF